MMRLSLLLLLCAGCARGLQAPATLPSRFTAASAAPPALYTGPTLVPVLYTNGQLAVYWTNPDTNLWYAECSTNLIDWVLCGNETVYLEDRAGRVNETNAVLPALRFTETVVWQERWFVRLRKHQP